jgi:hypothetical protein
MGRVKGVVRVGGSGDGWISQGKIGSKDGEDDGSVTAHWHGRLIWKGRGAGGCRASVRLLEDGSRDC